MKRNQTTQETTEISFVGYNSLSGYDSSVRIPSNKKFSPKLWRMSRNLQKCSDFISSKSHLHENYVSRRFLVFTSTKIQRLSKKAFPKRCPSTCTRLPSFLLST